MVPLCFSHQDTYKTHTFDVVEVPVPRRNGFHTRTKIRNRSIGFGILVRSQIVRHCCRLFCREFELLSRDATSSKLIMIFLKYLDSTGYRVHCTRYTRAVQLQRSPCPRSQTNIDAVRESVAASPKNLTATAHRSWDSLTLAIVVVCLSLVDIM